MSAIHVIRLRGPWDYTVLARFLPASEAGSPRYVESTESLPPPGRTTMPADWGPTLGQDFRGRVAFRRRFGRPTGVAASERVWIVCDAADARASVALNGHALGTIEGVASPADFDVTAMLDERNELVVVAECPWLAADGSAGLRGDRESLPGGLIGEVRLEIRDAPTHG